ncbi:MAG: hypothetical protein M3444_07345 [Acidobacteriota bacterium]|nr:hypothetical protein [Acidobacteriota bacterium]MDQ5835449.1 hypothetical protein [Acidobacteriota bacterium]
MKEPGIRLTIAGYCVNPSCRAPLYKELMAAPDDEACFDCNPPREGLPTAFRLLAESEGIDVEGKTEAEVFKALGLISPQGESKGSA